MADLSDATETEKQRLPVQDAMGNTDLTSLSQMGQEESSCDPAQLTCKQEAIQDTVSVKSSVLDSDSSPSDLGSL